MNSVFSLPCRIMSSRCGIVFNKGGKGAKGGQSGQTHSSIGTLIATTSISIGSPSFQ